MYKLTQAKISSLRNNCNKIGMNLWKYDTYWYNDSIKHYALPGEQSQQPIAFLEDMEAGYMEAVCTLVDQWLHYSNAMKLAHT